MTEEKEESIMEREWRKMKEEWRLCIEISRKYDELYHKNKPKRFYGEWKK